MIIFIQRSTQQSSIDESLTTRCQNDKTFVFEILKELTETAF